VGNPLIGATAGKHVRRGTPLGAFEGVSLERRLREEDKADEEKLRLKNAARGVYDLRVHEVGGFKFEQRRSRIAKQEASLDSFKSEIGAAEKALGFGSPRNSREQKRFQNQNQKGSERARRSRGSNPRTPCARSRETNGSLSMRPMSTRRREHASRRVAR
jgi:hypothetical protein